MDNQDSRKPDIEFSLFQKVTGFLSSYGWTCLFVLIVLNLIWSHFYPKYKRWCERLEDEKKEAEYKNDPSQIVKREENLALARQRLMEKHDQLAKEHEEKMRMKEEKKRQEKIEAMENLLRGKSTKSKPKNDSQTLRPEYNPLMGGSSGSSCFRPSRRGASSGG